MQSHKKRGSKLTWEKIYWFVWEKMQKKNPKAKANKSNGAAQALQASRPNSQGRKKQREYEDEDEH
jgi:hypothetical protein